MSNVSTAHTVNKFVAGKSEALSGQRLAKVGYKSTAKNPAKFASVCASVPYILNDPIKDNMEALIPHIRTMLENAQDGVIRSLYESSDGTLTQVTDQDISIQACINFLEAESQGSRLTKEYLQEWFKNTVQEPLSFVIGIKLGFVPADAESFDVTEAQAATIEKACNGYRDLFASLAGGKTMLQEKQIDSLIKALDMTETSDEIGNKLRARLDAMKVKPKQIEELLEL